MKTEQKFISQEAEIQAKVYGKTDGPEAPKALLDKQPIRSATDSVGGQSDVFKLTQENPANSPNSR